MRDFKLTWWLANGGKLAPPFDNAKLATALFADDALRNKRTPIAQLKHALEDDLHTKVFINHKGSEIDQIKSYLTSIFKLSNISMEGAEAWLLKQFICLPPEFHSYDTLVELINPQASEREAIFAATLHELTAKGWLLYNADTDSYKMHRILAEVSAAQITITTEDILPLVENITENLPKKTLQH